MKLRSSNLVLAAVEGNSKTFWLKFYLFASTAANANEMMLLQSMSAWWLDKIFSPPRLESHFQNQLDPHVCQKHDYSKQIITSNKGQQSSLHSQAQLYFAVNGSQQVVFMLNDTVEGSLLPEGGRFNMNSFWLQYKHRAARTNSALHIIVKGATCKRGH